MSLIGNVLCRAVATFSAALLFTVSSAEAAPVRGKSAPAFKTFSVAGNPVSSEGLKGSVILVDFWATWCPPCRESVPFLSELHNRYGSQGLQIIGMNVDDSGDKAAIRDYVQHNRIPYQIVSASRKIISDYSVRALPVIYLIDRKGILREQFMGFSAASGKLMESRIKAMLAEQ